MSSLNKMLVLKIAAAVAVVLMVLHVWNNRSRTFSEPYHSFFIATCVYTNGDYNMCRCLESKLAFLENGIVSESLPYTINYVRIIGRISDELYQEAVFKCAVDNYRILDQVE